MCVREPEGKTPGREGIRRGTTYQAPDVRKQEALLWVMYVVSQVVGFRQPSWPRGSFSRPCVWVWFPSITLSSCPRQTSVDLSPSLSPLAGFTELELGQLLMRSKHGLGSWNWTARSGSRLCGVRGGREVLFSRGEVHDCWIATQNIYLRVTSQLQNPGCN